MNKITFGKYKGKTYEYLINNDINYCIWISAQNSDNIELNKFKNYLIKSNILKNDAIEKLKLFKNTGVNCSVLSNYLKYNDNFYNLIKNYKIEITALKYNIEKNKNIPSDMFGIFIDYLIRYEISKIYFNNKNIIFTDNRTDYILSPLLSSENNTIICELKNIDFYNNQGKIIMKSYNNMKNYIASITDIFNVSLCHSLFFSNTNCINYINYNNIIDHTSHKNLINYIQYKLLNKQIVLCNPILGSNELKISADADLIIDEELIDIKTSEYNTGKNIDDFIQLFIYTGLYYKKTNIKCNKLTIYNPICSTEYTINIDDINFDNLIMNFL